MVEGGAMNGAHHDANFLTLDAAMSLDSDSNFRCDTSTLILTLTLLLTVDVISNLKIGLGYIHGTTVC